MYSENKKNKFVQEAKKIYVLIKILHSYRNITRTCIFDAILDHYRKKNTRDTKLVLKIVIKCQVSNSDLLNEHRPPAFATTAPIKLLHIIMLIIPHHFVTIFCKLFLCT